MRPQNRHRRRATPMRQDCTREQTRVLQFQVVFSSFLRMQLLNPLRVRGILAYFPQFIRVFWRLMHDRRVSFLAAARCPQRKTCMDLIGLRWINSSSFAS